MATAGSVAMETERTDSRAVAQVFGYTVDFMEELGRGAFGTVYKGYNHDDNIVAIKKVSKIEKRKASSEACKFYYLKQKDLQENQHVIRIDDVKQYKDSMWIIMEYRDLGDLNNFFKEHNQSLQSIGQKVKLMRQIINGIAFLHSKDIVHRDIKPGNILVTSSQNNCAVVKLGDFGLSKILDPESLTSAMSSNVGTLSFKAPEFWSNKPGERVKYHRNIDVYAAGLTFTAMLQARPGRRLVPRAERSLQSSETKMPIGLAAFSRVVSQHPDICVVEAKATDDKLTTEIKELIREMTHISPSDRKSASAVEDALDKMVDIGNVIHNYDVTLNFVPNSFCFVGNQLVVRGHQYKVKVIKVYDAETGNLSHQWQPQCQHFLPSGSLATCTMQHNAEYLVEGCPSKKCQVIRLYDLENRRVSVAYVNVRPFHICTGPKKSLLVSSWKSKTLLQLAQWENEDPDLTFHASHMVAMDHYAEELNAMSYASYCDVVILVTKETKQIIAADLATGDIVWKHNAFIGDVRLKPIDVCTTPDGWICVVDDNTLLAMDAANGRILKVLQSNIAVPKRLAASVNNYLAVRHGEVADNLSCYCVTTPYTSRLWSRDLCLEEVS